MNKWFKILTFILFIFAITTVSYITPGVLLSLSSVVNLTDNQLSNLLSLIDMTFSFIIAVYSLINQKRTEKRCQYEFLIEKNNLSLEAYVRFPTKIDNAFIYEYSRENEDIEKPFYGVEIPLQEEKIASVGIPISMQVITSISGNVLEFKQLSICAYKNGKNIVTKYRKKDKFLEINKTINNQKKFLIRIKLLCDNQLEKKLLDSCFYINFSIVFIDDKGRKYKRYIFITVQNVMGQSKILNSCSINSWLTYMRKLIEVKRVNSQ